MTTVFVVEDSSLVRRRIADNVGSIAGFEIVGVAEAENQAVAAIERLQPEVIVTDIQLKQGSGMGVLHSVRSKERNPRPIVVVLSNYAESEYKERAFAGGADAVFDKTTEYGQFLSALEAGIPARTPKQ